MDEYLLDLYGFMIRSGRYGFFKEHGDNISEDIWIESNNIYHWPGGIKNIKNNKKHKLKYFLELTNYEKQIVNILDSETELSYLNHGSGRIVFKKDNAVFKFSRYGEIGMMGDGVAQNCLEWKRFQNYGEKCNKIMPILSHSDKFYWLEMQYADNLLTNESNKTKDEIINEIKPIIQKYFKTTDIRPHNVGEYNNSWWLLDYGQPDKK